MSLDEFLYYNCPECDEKTQDYTEFFNHAVLMHELAQETLGSNEVKLEPDPYELNDGEDFEFPMDPSDIKKGENDYYDESFETIETTILRSQNFAYVKDIFGILWEILQKSEQMMTS